MKAKKQTSVFGVIAVVLLLAKFFPRVYGNVINRVGTATNMDASRTSEIINGVIFLSIVLVFISFLLILGIFILLLRSKISFKVIHK